MQLFDATNLAPSLRDRGWIGPDEPVAVRELTGGVSNVVLYVARSASPGGDFVVKQSRPQLRVAETWLCTVERIWREVDALRYCDELTEIGRPNEREGECVATPRVLFESRADYLYGMTAAPPGSRTCRNSRTWAVRPDWPSERWRQRERVS